MIGFIMNGRGMRTEGTLVTPSVLSSTRPEPLFFSSFCSYTFLFSGGSGSFMSFPSRPLFLDSETTDTE